MAYQKPPVVVQKKKAESLSFYISIPKKEIKNAIDRNKLKRRIRVILQNLDKKPCTIKIFVSQAALHTPFSQLQDIIKAQYD